MHESGIGWQKLNFSTQSNASIWVELAERIDCLIKDYIMRGIDSTLCNIETLKPLMQGAVPQKDTLFGAELELMRVEWSQIWPASVTKSTKHTVVWFFLEQTLKRRTKT
jgi:hypothetical protein